VQQHKNMVVSVGCINRSVVAGHILMQMLTLIPSLTVEKRKKRGVQGKRGWWW